jgi:hypothetical protein
MISLLPAMCVDPGAQVPVRGYRKPRLVTQYRRAECVSELLWGSIGVQSQHAPNMETGRMRGVLEQRVTGRLGRLSPPTAKMGRGVLSIMIYIRNEPKTYRPNQANRSIFSAATVAFILLNSFPKPVLYPMAISPNNASLTPQRVGWMLLRLQLAPVRSAP